MPQDQFIGRIVDGRYRLENTLGEGAAGVVWSANQIAVDRTVAVKLLHQSTHPDFARLFETEARAVGKLNHRNCLTLHDFGFDAGLDTYYMVTEYIDGELLSERMLDYMSDELILRIGLEVAMALEHAHEHGVLHRDLKPENIILTRSDGRWDTPKVLDFGLAKLMGDGPFAANSKAGRSGGLRPGTCVGTPIYMSPEQWAGKEAGPPADLYSLGVMLFELFEGGVPFDGASIEQVRARHLCQPIPSQRSSMSSPAVKALIYRMLAKDPRDRLQTAAEVVAALNAELNPGKAIGLGALESEEWILEPVVEEPVESARVSRSTPAPALAEVDVVVDVEPQVELEVELEDVEEESGVHPRLLLYLAAVLLATVGAAGMAMVQASQRNASALAAAEAAEAARAVVAPARLYVFDPSPAIELGGDVAGAARDLATAAAEARRAQRR